MPKTLILPEVNFVERTFRRADRCFDRMILALKNSSIDQDGKIQTRLLEAKVANMEANLAILESFPESEQDRPWQEAGH